MHQLPMGTAITLYLIHLELQFYIESDIYEAQTLAFPGQLIFPEIFLCLIKRILNASPYDNRQENGLTDRFCQKIKEYNQTIGT